MSRVLHLYISFIPKIFFAARAKTNKILSRIKEIEMTISSAKIQNHCSKISISSDQKLFSEGFCTKWVLSSMRFGKG